MWQKIKYFWSRTNRFHRGLFIFLIVELKLIPGGQLGFLCNNPALAHPFTGDTISWKWLLGVTIFLPLLVMLIVEKKFCCEDKQSQDPRQQALLWYKEYLFGLLINLILIQTLKQIVGAPRPHFFDTCSPAEALTCKDNEYVSKYTCTKSHWLSTSDKSFPSGHTSLAVHAGIFIVYYLQRRVRRSGWRACWQAAGAGAAGLCALSRLSDHRHHWWDVLTGAVLAAPILLYTTHNLCKKFECSSKCQDATDNGNGVKTQVITT